MFFLEAIALVADESKARAQRVLGLQKEYRERIKAETSTQTPLAAIDLIMSQVVVTVKQVADHCHCRPATAKSAMELLARLQIVREIKRKHPQTWAAQELISEVYSL